MKKKYLTLEEVLALRETDTKIYDETYQEEVYFQYLGGILCRFYKNKLDLIGDSFCKTNKPYILEPEEFKVEKVGLYKTRDGSTAFVSCIDEHYVNGIILGDDYVTRWDLDGTFCGNKDLDLVEYVGD